MPTIVNTDGGTRGNPGPASWGVVIRRPKDGLTTLTGMMTKPTGEIKWATNNEAEYQAMIEALTWLNRNRVTGKVIIRADSELVVKQLDGRYMVRNATLLPYWTLAYAEFVALQDRCEVELTHIPREQNKEADALCNKTMDDNGATFVHHPRGNDGKRASK